MRTWSSPSGECICDNCDRLFSAVRPLRPVPVIVLKVVVTAVHVPPLPSRPVASWAPRASVSRGVAAHRPPAPCVLCPPLHHAPRPRGRTRTCDMAQDDREKHIHTCTARHVRAETAAGAASPSGPGRCTVFRARGSGAVSNVAPARPPPPVIYLFGFIISIFGFNLGVRAKKCTYICYFTVSAYHVPTWACLRFLTPFRFYINSIGKLSGLSLR